MDANDCLGTSFHWMSVRKSGFRNAKSTTIPIKQKTNTQNHQGRLWVGALIRHLL